MTKLTYAPFQAFVSQQNLSYRRIRKDTGLSTETIYKLLKSNKPVSHGTLTRLCRTYNLSLPQIISTEEA